MNNVNVDYRKRMIEVKDLGGSFLVRCVGYEDMPAKDWDQVEEWAAWLEERERVRLSYKKG